MNARIYYLLFILMLCCQAHLFGQQNSNALFDAVKAGNVAKAKALIAAGADVDVSNDNIYLINLAIEGPPETHLPMLRLLLDAGADVNSYNPTSYKMPVLMEAIINKKNTAELVKLLLERGARPNLTIQGEVSAMHIAAVYFDSQVMNLLIEAGGRVNMRDTNGYTPLMKAAQQNHLNAVDYLVTHGAKIDIETYSGSTALDIAQLTNEQLVVDYLKVLSPKTNYEYIKPLLDAQTGKPGIELLRRLISQSIDARLEKDTWIGKYLFLKDSTPLHIAAGLGYKDITQALVQAEAYIHAVDREGNFPTTICVANNRQALLPYLVNTGGYINVANSLDVTPIGLACQQNNLPMVKLLIKLGCIATSEGLQLMIQSASANQLEMVKLLVENGVSVEQTTPTGKTPLLIAAEKGYIPLIHYLIEKGADVEATDDGGKSAFDYAKDEEVIAVLKSYQPNTTSL